MASRDLNVHHRLSLQRAERVLALPGSSAEDIAAASHQARRLELLRLEADAYVQHDQAYRQLSTARDAGAEEDVLRRLPGAQAGLSTVLDVRSRDVQDFEDEHANELAHERDAFSFDSSEPLTGSG